jgi:exodeoxyribonuclease VII small subunit|tara:strand:+ start:10287 stop:10586 length:300 start_codon:yes stop_codon:yes gene_type:complete
MKPTQPILNPLIFYKKSKNIMTDKSINLEKSLSDLEVLVTELEKGDLPLEDAMKKFEQGIKLTRACQLALKEAEQKVEILLQNHDDDILKTFDNEADND